MSTWVRRIGRIMYLARVHSIRQTIHLREVQYRLHSECSQWPISMYSIDKFDLSKWFLLLQQYLQYYPH
jgi:hypothetical protein